MPLLNNAGTGQASAAAANVTRQLRVEVAAGGGSTTDIICVAGMPSFAIQLTQSTGAVAGSVQLDIAAVGGQTNGLDFLRWGSLVVTPFGVPQLIEGRAAFRFIRLTVTAPAANDIIVTVTILASQ